MRAPASAAVRMPSSRVARNRSASASQACWTRPTRTGGAVGSWTRASEVGTSAAVIRRMRASMPVAEGGDATAYDPPMRVSRFWALAEDEFGAAYAHSLAGSTHMAALGGRTAQEALDAGVPPRDVWFALCDAMDVPENRRHGLDKPARN